MSLAILAAMILAVAPAQGAVQSGGELLRGTWESDCLPTGRGGRHGLITHITFVGDRVEATAQMYAGNGCDTPTFKVTYRGQALHTQAADGGVLFDHTIGSVALTPQAQDVIDIYNRPGDPRGCGLKDWRIGEEKSVAGRTCEPFTFATEKTTLYDAAWREGDRLRFGAFPMLWANSEAEKRPTQPLPPLYHRSTPYPCADPPQGDRSTR